jgi:hypothetical protein
MSLRAPDHVHTLLARLHSESLSQEEVLKSEGMGHVDFDTYMKDKYIALEKEKCEYVYLLARAMSAKNIVEVSGQSRTMSSYLLDLSISSITLASITGWRGLCVEAAGTT